MLTTKELKDVLEYDPETGYFIWLAMLSNSIKIGNIAGHLDSYGYRVISLARRDYKAHRLAWFYMTGEWPKDQIDHINGIKDDNRWVNLREATSQQNNMNRGQRKNASSQYKGVHWDKNTKKWRAKTKKDGKYVHIGFFSCEKEAALAYNKVVKDLHGGCARLNKV